jgi:hypothetical protein
LSTSMSLPYSQLYSLVDLPGEVLLANIALAAPYAVVRRELRNRFEVNYSRFPSGHMFELTYNRRVSVCALCVAGIDWWMRAIILNKFLLICILLATPPEPGISLAHGASKMKTKVMLCNLSNTI